MKLIDKDALVAEINARISYWKERKDNCLKNDILGICTCDSRITELNNLLSSIKSLEVKEVDLEKPFEGIKVQTSMESGSLDEIIVTTKYKAQKGEGV